MEKVDGKNIYEYRNIPEERKKDILKQIVECLKSVQKLEGCVADKDSYYEAYIGKTFDRLEKVKKLVPFADKEYVTVNGRKCRNVFFVRNELEQKVMRYIFKITLLYFFIPSTLSNSKFSALIVYTFFCNYISVNYKSIKGTTFFYF